MKKSLAYLFIVLGLFLSENVFAKTINSYEDLDLTSKPKKILNESKTKSLWNAYKKASECFDHPTYGEGFGYKLKKQKENYFIKNEWSSPFYKYSEVEKYNTKFDRIGPKPLEKIKLDESYGQEVELANFAAYYFQQAAYISRVSNSNNDIENIKTTILDWATKNALREGINVSWGEKPVDWQMMVLINSILTTTAVIAESFDSEERKIIGPWLNKLVEKVAKSSWKDRQDNKSYLTSYITLIWGLMINDLNAVQNSIDVVKLAIHDMRPDGSFPIDTQRSGMGIKYNSDSYGYLLMIASLLKDKTGLDLFLYDVKGRSLHNGADFVVRSIKEPSKINSIYAISCPGGGDRWGSIERPSINHIRKNETTYLLVYANKFPENKHSNYIIKKYGYTFNDTTNSDIKFFRSNPSRVFTLHPMLITK